MCRKKRTIVVLRAKSRRECAVMRVLVQEKTPPSPLATFESTSNVSKNNRTFQNRVTLLQRDASLRDPRIAIMFLLLYRNIVRSSDKSKVNKNK